MSSHFLSLSRRIRKTHFTDRVIENGVKGFTVYNHMLLPTYFESVEDDYHHLKKEKYRFGMYLVKDKLKLMAKIVLSS